MWQRKFKRFFQITACIISKILTIIRTIIIKGFRVMRQPKLRRPLQISSGIMGITAFLVLSLTGLFNYVPDTSVSCPYIPPPAGESNYYMEATTGGLWDEFLSPYSDLFTANVSYVGESFIFKNILIDEYKLSKRYENYILIELVQFVPRDPSDLQELRENDLIDIIGVCIGLSNLSPYIAIGNCQFLPAGIAPLPLPGGPAPLAGGY